MRDPQWRKRLSKRGLVIVVAFVAALTFTTGRRRWHNDRRH
jgi:hypothetical protein